MTLLSLEGLGKRYTVRPERSIALGFVRKYRPHTFWALRGLDLSLEPGEILSVIGRNGAGKSTLLKLAVGVTKPSEGVINRPERIAPLIEVGAGFHPELTGRENVTVNGRLLGLSKQQVASRFDEIVDFAQLRQAIDQPIKQYSSGMYMRLGFAVAIHTDPELLIVDEVLAVGDLPFQMQCINRIKSLRDQGVGVLFVSHNLSAVLDVSDRSILLDKGSLIEAGTPQDVVGAYHRLLEEQGADDDGEIGVYDSAGEMKLLSITAKDDSGDSKALWEPGDRVNIDMLFEATAETPGGYFVGQLVREGSGPVANWRTDHLDPIPPMSPGEKIAITASIRLHVVEGAYQLGIGMSRHGKTGLMVRHEGALRLAVGKRRGIAGVVDIDPTFEISPA